MTSAREPETLAERQGRLLRRIQHLAGEKLRVDVAGPAMFADSGGTESPEQVWQQRLDHLETERVEAERDALLAGVDRGWIDDARELGSRSITAADRAVVRQHPDRATGIQEFYIEMLEVDVWHLERMAGLDAARTDRIGTGRWSFDDNPDAQRQFYTNMFRHHQRITVLAAAAQITSIEGEQLWGASVEGIRRMQTAAIAHLGEAALAQEWNSYARPDPMLRVPPYVPQDPMTGTPTAPTLVVPPSPRKMLIDANAALRTQFVETALHRAEPVDLAAEGIAITTFVDAALADDGELVWEPDNDPPPGRVREGAERTPEL
ncbi:hypothetical protein [Nocardia sp. NPDC058497]|uniref:hypothetical protein n=1 Tax=Nocardia sp. NPDC058497 TaxID=3346529 RepID=UPI00365C96A7